VSDEVLQRLRALVRAEGGLLAQQLADGERDGAVDGHGARGEPPFSPSAALARAPRTRANHAEYELLVEAIYEGYLLHYGQPRVLAASEADLSLLVGDQLYALGLARLVALGDTLAVAELADTITLCALAHGAHDAQLARAVWAAGTRAVGWGASERHRRAKELVLAGDPEALDAMRTCARDGAGPRPQAPRYC
jgi:hypothetical protein